jgi:hypothetical protein
MFTCTLDYVGHSEALLLLKNKPGACIDNGASSHYCLNRMKFQNFQNYQSIDDRITTTDKWAT